MIQWERLRQYSLLADQTVQPLNLGDSVLNFSDVEEQVWLFDKNWALPVVGQIKNENT